MQVENDRWSVQPITYSHLCMNMAQQFIELCGMVGVASPTTVQHIKDQQATVFIDDRENCLGVIVGCRPGGRRPEVMVLAVASRRHFNLSRDRALNSIATLHLLDGRLSDKSSLRPVPEYVSKDLLEILEDTLRSASGIGLY